MQTMRKKCRTWSDRSRACGTNSRTHTICKESQSLRTKSRQKRRSYFLYTRRPKRRCKLCVPKTNCLGSKRHSLKSVKIRRAVSTKASGQQKKNSRRRKKNSVNLSLKWKQSMNRYCAMKRKPENWLCSSKPKKTKVWAQDLRNYQITTSKRILKML